MFDQLQGNGRVWIYVAQRALDQAELANINQRMTAFLGEWSAHGAKLHAGFEIYMDQVLILAVDENFEAASGCSIDTSVDQFRQIDQEFQLDLFNRLKIPFVQNEMIELYQMQSIGQAVQNGMLKANDLLIDTTISNLTELRTALTKPLNQSWLAKRIKHLATVD